MVPDTNRVKASLFPETMPAHDPGGKVRLRLAAGITSEAVFSDCQRYRYTLTRRWADGKTLLACMMNPSTADETVNDPTVAKVQRYAERWGFGALSVVNIFAYRCTDPKRLREMDDPVGPENDAAIRAQARQAGLILMAYGVPPHKDLRERGAAVAGMLRADGHTLHALEFAKCGSPKHPLYLRGDLMPVIWKRSV